MIRHITFVRPNLGAGRSADAMTPLVFAILRALTPASIETTLIDERIEPFAPVATDLVAITVETFTARRAYEIADAYRARGVRVVMGGHHPSMRPDEALEHADAVVIGDAEGAWPRLLDDAARGALARVYRGEMGIVDSAPFALDRSVFSGKRYLPISLVQVGRGCRFACDFCSIHAFYGVKRAQRAADDVATEVARLPPRRLVFFVDDNLYWRRDRLEELCRALAPLKRRWMCQITIDVARDDALIDLMAESGCELVLIGFESLNAASLKQMRKNWSGVAGAYGDVVRRLHARGIMIYGAFVFGYDADGPQDFDAARRFAQESNLTIANFNPLTPMPGTGLYDRLAAEGRLLRPDWWIDPEFRYGDALFTPRGMSPADLAAGPMRARRAFYSWPSILSRVLRGVPLWRNPLRSAMMLFANWVSRREIARKHAAALAGPESSR